MGCLFETQGVRVIVYMASTWRQGDRILYGVHLATEFAVWRRHDLLWSPYGVLQHNVCMPNVIYVVML